MCEELLYLILTLIKSVFIHRYVLIVWWDKFVKSSLVLQLVSLHISMDVLNLLPLSGTTPSLVIAPWQHTQSPVLPHTVRERETAKWVDKQLNVPCRSSSGDGSIKVTVFHLKETKMHTFGFGDRSGSEIG